MWHPILTVVSDYLPVYTLAKMGRVCKEWRGYDTDHRYKKELNRICPGVSDDDYVKKTNKERVIQIYNFIDIVAYAYHGKMHSYRTVYSGCVMGFISKSFRSYRTKNYVNLKNLTMLKEGTTRLLYRKVYPFNNIIHISPCDTTEIDFSLESLTMYNFLTLGKLGFDKLHHWENRKIIIKRDFRDHIVGVLRKKFSCTNVLTYEESEKEF